MTKKGSTRVREGSAIEKEVTWKVKYWVENELITIKAFASIHVVTFDMSLSKTTSSVDINVPCSSFNICKLVVGK